MQVLVIGGTGNTGQHIVQQLQARGDHVRVLSRQARRGADSGAIELVAGSITDPEAVRSAVAGMDGVVICVESANSSSSANAPEAVHHQGVENVIEAARAQNSHIVLVTQIYITRPEAYASIANIIAARDQGERALRRSGLPYTIVRPSWLTDNPPGQQAVRLEQGDTGEGSISRADVAAACVNALHDKEAQGKTFEMYNVPGAITDDWHHLFARLQTDDQE